MPLASAVENQSQIPQFSLWLSYFYFGSSRTTAVGNGLALGTQNTLRNTSFTEEIRLWQDTGTHYGEDTSFFIASFHFLKQFGSFCKERKSLWDYGKKCWYTAPFCFHFFSFWVSQQRHVGQIHSYLEWILGSERSYTIVSSCPYSSRQR